MATTPTQLPIPSEKPQDLKFNAGKIDEFATSMGWTYTDRFGVKHHTIDGLKHLAEQAISAFGYITIDSFEDGATLTIPNQVLRWKANGEYYRWDGKFPKVVASGSTPETTGGIGNGNWLSVGAAALASTQEGSGDALVAVKQPFNGSVARSQHDKNAEIISVLDFPGIKMDGITDCTIGMNLAASSGKSILFPLPLNGPALISGPILLTNGTKFYGPGKEFIVVKCADSMDPNMHAFVTSNYANGILTANTGIRLEGICVDGNGYIRAPGTDKPSGCNFVINGIDSEVVDCHGIAAPLWNYFFTSGNPFEDVGHDGEVKAPSKRIYFDECKSTDPIHGDGVIAQGVWGLNTPSYTSIFTDRLIALGGKVRADAGLQIIEGCRDVTLGTLNFDHGNSVTTGLGISCHVNKPYLSNINVGCVLAQNLNTAVGIFNDASVVPVGGVSWKSRIININLIHLKHPVIDPTSSVMQARAFDCQNAMSVKVGDVSVSFLSDDGSYSSPTAVVNFAGTHDFNVDSIEMKGVPDTGSTSYTINRGRGWVAVGDATCKRGKIGTINMDNIGYYNRVISDTLSLCLESIGNIVIDESPADGQAKVAVVCGSSLLAMNKFILPSGMTRGTAGPIYSLITQDNVQINISASKFNYGGEIIRANSPAGVQGAPGILFDRQFVSGSDPIGANGKGAISFRTSDLATGTFSITAYHEDLNQYRPIVYARSTTFPAKAWSPVIDNDTNLGEISNRWKQIAAATSTIVTSDDRYKMEKVDISELEKKVALKLKGMMKRYKFIDAVDEKGEKDARYHFGIIAQEVAQVFDEFGLDASQYGLFCYDKWDDEYVRIEEIPEVTDEATGEVIVSYHEAITHQTKVAGDRYGIRYEELICFILASL